MLGSVKMSGAKVVLTPQPWRMIGRSRIASGKRRERGLSCGRFALHSHGRNRSQRRGAQRVHELAHGTELLQPRDAIDDRIDPAGRQARGRIGSELLLDLVPGDRELRRTARVIAALAQGRAVLHVDFDDRLDAGQIGTRRYLDTLGSVAQQLWVVVPHGLELGEGQLTIMKYHGGGVMAGDQRVELSFVVGAPWRD